MVVKRSGLGRNLSALLTQTNSSALFPDDPAGLNESQPPTVLALKQLQPGKYQPRRNIAEDALLELASSIQKHGLLQPVIVRAVAPNQYEIIAGERRWRACQMAGLSNIPVVVRDVDDATAMAFALIENLQREDLNALDEARAMHRLTTEFALTHQQVAELLSKSRASVSNSLRLLQLSTEVRRLLEQGALDMGHARALLMLNEKEQCEAAQWVVAKQLSVRETEALVARIKAGFPLQKEKRHPEPLFEDALKALGSQLQTKVRLKQNASGKGTLIIHYKNSDTLQGLLERFLMFERSE